MQRKSGRPVLNPEEQNDLEEFKGLNQQTGTPRLAVEELSSYQQSTFIEQWPMYDVPGPFSQAGNMTAFHEPSTCFTQNFQPESQLVDQNERLLPMQSAFDVLE